MSEGEDIIGREEGSGMGEDIIGREGGRRGRMGRMSFREFHLEYTQMKVTIHRPKTHLLLPSTRLLGGIYVVQ